MGPIRNLSAAAAISLGLALVACSSSSSGTSSATTAGAAPATSAADAARRPLAAVWGGTVAGTDAFVAVASNGTEVLAYVCDGASIAQWFHGTDRAGSAVDLAAGTVSNKDDHGALQAALNLDTASGSVTVRDGRTLPFSAARVGGDAGLYRSEETVDGSAWTGGWVVLGDGKLRGALLSSTGVIQGLSALRPSARLIEPDTRAY